MYLENIFLAVSNIQFSTGKIGNNFMKTAFRKDQLNNRFKCGTHYFMVSQKKKEKRIAFRSSYQTDPRYKIFGVKY